MKSYLAALALLCSIIPAKADSLWDHNGSLMRLLADGNLRQFVYERPRQGMMVAGAQTGDSVFIGSVVDGQYVGTAYIFSGRCGRFPYQVVGPIVSNSTRVVMQGSAPRIDRDCRVYDRFLDTLEFSYVAQAGRY